MNGHTQKKNSREETLSGSADRIRTTHVGSLVRPPKLVEFLRQIEGQQPYDQAAYEACLKESIEEVVRRQGQGARRVPAGGGARERAAGGQERALSG